MHRLDSMTPQDWPEVRVIYAEGIATGLATLETAPPSWEAWDRDHVPAPRLVARAGGVGVEVGGGGMGTVGTESGVSVGAPAPAAGPIAGWAALTPVSGRCVYAGVAEVSVYVAAAARGRGIGRLLLDGLVEASERAGLWTLQAGIFPENVASLALHRVCGFREVGRRERIGRHRGRWQDIMLLERRSAVVGID